MSASKGKGYVSRLLDDVGDGSGSADMNVDGSALGYHFCAVQGTK